MKSNRTIFVTDSRVYFFIAKLRGKDLGIVNKDDYEAILGQWKIFMSGPDHLLGIYLTQPLYEGLRKLEFLTQRDSRLFTRMGLEAPGRGMQQPMQDAIRLQASVVPRRPKYYWNDKLADILALSESGATAPALAAQYGTSAAQIYSLVVLARKKAGKEPKIKSPKRNFQRRG